MKRQIIKALVCILFMPQVATAAETKPAESVLIENVTVISAHLDQAQPNMDVLIRDGRIQHIIKTGADYQAEIRIDGRKKYLIPGLIDSHVHLGHNPLINRTDLKEYETIHNEYRRQLPRSFLFHGFTSVIDLDHEPARSGWPEGTELSPEIYHCGRGVRVAGGYGPAFVPPEFVHKVFPNLVYEQRHSDNWPERLNPDLYTVGEAVRRVVQSGAICLKTYSESGFGGVFDWSQPSAETLAALSKAAHQEGLVFVVHANSAADWQRAIAADADVIAHGLWHWNADRQDSQLSSEPLSAIEAAVESKVAVQPTLRVVEGESSTLDQGLMQDQRILDVLTPGIMDYLRSDKGQWSLTQLLELYRKHNPQPEIVPSVLISASIQRATDSMVTFHQSGGTLLLGTDTPAQDGTGNPPGLNGFLEMTSWAQAGIALDSIFRSATLDNARAFKLDHEIGSIEPGKQADLLLLNSNPLETVEAYNDISVVMINGRPINRGDLSARSLDMKPAQ